MSKMDHDAVSAEESAAEGNYLLSVASKEECGDSEGVSEFAMQDPGFSKKQDLALASVPSLSLLGKREIARPLFLDCNKKQVVEGTKKLEEGSSSISLHSSPSLPKLALLQISLTKQRFAFEGKILNVYGTYDNDKNYKKILRTDLTDEVGFGTITLSFGPEIYKKHLPKIIVGACIRVEGAVVTPRAVNDGGSVDFTLHVDATTHISLVDTFETTLFFVPELSIRAFLKKVVSTPSLKSTIAFVIVQVDHVQKSEGGLFEQLTIADGPLATDRATLTFVSKRKPLYYQLVDQFHKGNVVPYLARNVGAWKEKSNTLSVLDLTLIVPLFGERRKKQLIEVFHLQVAEQGYGKEVFGILSITNFNGTLLVKKCRVCKSQNLNSLSQGGFCFSCGMNVDVDEVLKLLGEIKHGGSSSEVILTGDACDSVLQFERPLLELYKESAILTRVRLSEVAVEGYFILDSQGQVFGFRQKTETTLA